MCQTAADQSCVLILALQVEIVTEFAHANERIFFAQVDIIKYKFSLYTPNCNTAMYSCFRSVDLELGNLDAPMRATCRSPQDACVLALVCTHSLKNKT